MKEPFPIPCNALQKTCTSMPSSPIVSSIIATPRAEIFIKPINSPCTYS